MIDYALGLDKLVPSAKCTRVSTYEDIQKYWEDERPIPSKEAIERASEEAMKGILEQERQKQVMGAVLQLMKNKDISKTVPTPTRMELTSALTEFNALGQVDISLYPKAQAQIGDWIQKGLIPQ